MTKIHINNKPCPKGSQTTTTVNLHTLVLHCRSIKNRFIIKQYLSYILRSNNGEQFICCWKKSTGISAASHVILLLVALRLFGGCFSCRSALPLPLLLLGLQSRLQLGVPGPIFLLVQIQHNAVILYLQCCRTLIRVKLHRKSWLYSCRTVALQSWNISDRGMVLNQNFF